MAELMRRRAMMASTSRRIPGMYTELEYLIAPLGAYFQDDFGSEEILNGFSTKYRITSRPNNWSPYICAGTIKFIPRSQAQVCINLGSGGDNFINNYKDFSNLNNDYTVEANTDGTCKLLSNGNPITTLTVGNRAATEIEILMQPSDGIVKFAGRLYWLKLFSSGSCMHEYVPCIRKEDNVVGIYDVMTNKFLTNAGTGTITPGPTIGG